MDGRAGSLRINQDADIHATILDGHAEIVHVLRKSRIAYLHVVKGSMHLDDIELSSGDGAKITDEDAVRLRSNGRCEALLFDLKA
jgi:redox-sensitive bicupin YhaK (pirin superfamily)